MFDSAVEGYFLQGTAVSEIVRKIKHRYIIKPGFEVIRTSIFVIHFAKIRPLVMTSIKFVIIKGAIKVVI